MAESAAARRVADAVSSIVTPAVAKRAIAKQDDAITTNPVYQIMLAEETDPEQKRAAITAFLTFAESKEESKQRLAAFEAFEEYMQSVREAMAQEIIRLTDTETFSELKSVYDDLNNALIDFDNRMRPLTEIIDAVYALRTNDKTLDAFKEIQADRKREEANRQVIEQKTREFDAIESRIRGLNSSIAALGEERGFFGLGGVTKKARQDIAQRELEVKESLTKLNALRGDMATLEQQTPTESTLGEYTAQKAKLRELLDITSDEHKQRQRDLVDAALNFVQVAKDRVGSVRSHLGQMSGQIENLYDANTRMSSAYAVLSEGIKGAEDANQGLAQELAKAPDEESLIIKMARTGKEESVLDHIKALQNAGANTTATYADLTSQTIRIKTMKDSNQSQLDKARVMHSQGVAGVADRLSVVLQAVSSAALGESSAMTKDTLQKMVESTSKVAQQEAIRVAIGVNDMNQDLIKAIDDLGTYGEIMRTSTTITRDGLTEMRSSLDQIKKLAESVHGDIHDAIAVNAEVGKGAPQAAAAKPEAPKTMFGIGR